MGSNRVIVQVGDVAETRRRIERLLGCTDADLRFAKSETISTTELGDRVIYDLRFEMHDGEAVPAWFVQPLGCSAPCPAILYLHAHGARYDIGRAELFDGRPALQRPYIDDLVGAGLAVLCIEMPCFGARQVPNESARSKAHLWHGTTLYGRMIHELRCGLTFLSAHAAIDPKRIGTLGISMGGTQAFWLAALDERVAASVSLCAFADLACLIETGEHDKHGHYMTVPGLVAETSTGALAGLAAPRPQFFGVGMKDWSSPPICLEKARAEIERIYNDRDARDALFFHVETEAGHEETAAMRGAVLSFLRQTLSAPTSP